MNLTNHLARAASVSQSTLAQLQGAAPGENNVHFTGGVECLGVFGHPQPDEVPAPGGGYRKRTVTVLTVTRPQLEVAPAAKTSLTRLDLPARPKYTIDRVDTQDPLHWVFYLVNFAG